MILEMKGCHRSKHLRCAHKIISGRILQQTQKMHVLPHYAANQTVKHYSDTQSNV